MINESQSWKDEFYLRVKHSFENEKQLSLLSGFKIGSETLNDRIKSDYVRMRMRMLLNAIN